MTALQLKDGTLLANNGVQAGEGDGMLGLRKFASHSEFTAAAVKPAEPARTKRSSREKNSVSDCRRIAQLHEDVRYLSGAWPCKARQSTTGRRYEGIMDRLSERLDDWKVFLRETCGSVARMYD